MNLTFDHVHKHFGDLPVVDGFTSEFKTGELVALVVALLFLAALFISPLAGAVPAYATAPALLYVAGQEQQRHDQRGQAGAAAGLHARGAFDVGGGAAGARCV